MGSKILVRDNMSDGGGKTPYMSYSSPDIITHSQVGDPKSFFTGNYASDPNEPLGTQNDNYIYVRAKNIGDAASEELYVNLYANQLSLYLDPQKWEKNRIPTIRGNQYSTIDALAKGEIGVTKDYFLFKREKYGNSCFVTAIGSDKNPDFTWIRSWNDYVEWVTANSNVAARNMATYKEKEKRQYENHLNLSNPYETAATFMISVEANDKVPDSTKFGIESKTFQIQHEETCSSTKKKFSVTTTLQPGQDDYITFYGALGSAAGNWPTGASLIVRAVLVQFEMDVVHDRGVLQTMKEDGYFRNARYLLTPDEKDRLYGKAPSVKVQSLTADSAASMGPVFGLIIGECGVRYI